MAQTKKDKVNEPWGIHWFRRDLRLVGNTALQDHWKQRHGRVLGVFAFDEKFLARPDFSIKRFLFFLQTLAALRDEMRAAGGDLLFLNEGPEAAFSWLFEELQRHSQSLPASVSWNRDYEPFAIRRDQTLRAVLESRGISCLTQRDHLLIEPHEIYKGQDQDDGYQVFSPFFKKWVEVSSGAEVRSRVEIQQKSLQRFHAQTTAVARASSNHSSVFCLKWSLLLDPSFVKDSDQRLQAISENAKKRVDIPLPVAGFRAALAAAENFSPKLAAYRKQRDLPGEAGTSKLSIYFKNGSFTVPQAIAYLNLVVKPKDESSSGKYLAELVWREFYYHILARHPRVEHGAFLEKFAKIDWENREDHFAAWCKGQTGFPIVDAGMRELLLTGWMHNRVRMIVASFLTKDLLIDWRWGEKFFMQHLLDGDLAPNNGGWQWAASTGCDAQPYFRIFNPTLQSQRFDPTGTYIKKFVPELSSLDHRSIHVPTSQQRAICRYPEPIVDHKVQREKALALYGVVSR